MLVVTATAMTFALSYAVHSHRAPGIAASAVAPPPQPWTGELADAPAPEAQPVGTEPITSASLVVSKAELALPQPPIRALVKLRGCAGQSCVARPASAPSAPRRSSEETTVVARHGTQRVKPSFMARLNPFNHLPDTTSIKRPFVFAGDAVSGWFKRF